MLRLPDIARLPEPGDNAAIAVRTLEPGTRYRHEGRVISLSHTVLEGHRFAARELKSGEPLLSWGLPFGVATGPIAAGTYLCNQAMLDALSLRRLKARLPSAPNFVDKDLQFAFDENGFQPGRPLEPIASPGTFSGFARPGGRRGTGTRNFVVLLGTSSRAASFARALARRLAGVAERYPNIDGIVAATHTEGGGDDAPNNLDLVLRTLAGFMVHPNVGAVLAIDQGGEAVNNARLRAWLEDHDYPLADVVHAFFSMPPDLAAGLARAAGLVESWLDDVNRGRRSERPLCELRIAMQCGGSDAFSGISGNPLAAGVARELIRHGGAACLAETDELIGAEPYILENTRDLATARAFLGCIARFEERAAWHGQSVRDNATGGNKLRGLYNVTLKSIGAARKKDPGVCLEHVIDYAERMQAPGFHFMDSPGNDLESIAGQVAAGCNLILFITGNGSITNFPFVPTVKIMTTTGRWSLMPEDMDINAGRYLDGEPMEVLESEAFDQCVGIASGEASAGERAGHSQLSIWRNWRQAGPVGADTRSAADLPDGAPQPLDARGEDIGHFSALPGAHGPAVQQVGLILPTSLCSGQIAARIASRLTGKLAGPGRGLDRFVALVHTEGCGASSGDNETMYLRTMASYLVHPGVRTALLLEHGCEHTHNDLFRRALESRGINPREFGFASIQLDGGIERVSASVEAWFEERLASLPGLRREPAELGRAGLGLVVHGTAGDELANALAVLSRAFVAAGGSVVIPSASGLAPPARYFDALGLSASTAATLAYGQAIERPGFHVMDTPDNHGVEALTGIGASGVQLLLVCNAPPPAQCHPMLPTLHLSEQRSGEVDLEIAADADSAAIFADLRRLLAEAASGARLPALWQQGYSDFQISRGRMGISL